MRQLQQMALMTVVEALVAEASVLAVEAMMAYVEPLGLKHSAAKWFRPLHQEYSDNLELLDVVMMLHFHQWRDFVSSKNVTRLSFLISLQILFFLAVNYKYFVTSCFILCRNQ